MSFQSDINRFLEKHPGSMAKDIAIALDVTRKEVNRFLYSHISEYRIDNRYCWYLKNNLNYNDKVLKKLNNFSGAKVFTEQEFRHLADWKHGYSHSHDGYFKYVCQNGDIIYCDSQSEIKILEYLEDNDLFLAVGGQALCIEYDSYFVGGRSYYPDIIILTPKQHIAIIEIKAATAMSNHMNMEKYQALAKYCVEKGFEYMMIDPAKDFMTYNEIEEMAVCSGIKKEFDNLKRLANPYSSFDKSDVEDWYNKYGGACTKRDFQLQVHSMIMYYNWYNFFSNGFKVFSCPVKLDQNYNVIEYIPQ